MLTPHNVHVLIHVNIMDQKPLMLLTYRYKLVLKKAQYGLLDQLCDGQRQLYNAALQERIDAWKKSRVSISKIDQNKSLTIIRSFDETYASVPVSMSRWSIARVDDAFKGFFSRFKRGVKAGFPRFKPKSRWNSFGFDEWNGIRLVNGRLVFKSAGPGLKLNLHRPIPDGSAFKACTFTRTGRHWFVCIQLDAPIEGVHAHPGSSVGIDVGIEYLLTTSDGSLVENIRPRAALSKNLRLRQRALARCKKGSKRRAKVRERLRLAQRKVANVRSTYLHQVSEALARRYELIGMEKLTVKNMTKSAKGTAEEPGTNVRQKAGLNRSMLDASLAKLILFTNYKAERAGGKMEKVIAKGTSQDCSSCGETVIKPLSERTHCCLSCGLKIHRDLNAALNILDRALAARGRARSPGDLNVGHWPVRGLGNTVCEAA